MHSVCQWLGNVQTAAMDCILQVCGPGAFMDAVTDAALSLCVPADHMYQESFSF